MVSMSWACVTKSITPRHSRRAAPIKSNSRSLDFTPHAIRIAWGTRFARDDTALVANELFPRIPRGMAAVSWLKKALAHEKTRYVECSPAHSLNLPTKPRQNRCLFRHSLPAPNTASSRAKRSGAEGSAFLRLRLARLGLKPFWGQVFPSPVSCLDERNLLGAIPSLDLLLPRNSAASVTVHFKIDETMNAIAFRETRIGSLPVLCDSTRQVVCHARVERPGPAGENVNVVRHSHTRKADPSTPLRSARDDAISG